MLFCSSVHSYSFVVAFLLSHIQFTLFDNILYCTHTRARTHAHTRRHIHFGIETMDKKASHSTNWNVYTSCMLYEYACCVCMHASTCTCTQTHANQSKSFILGRVCMYARELKKNKVSTMCFASLQFCLFAPHVTYYTHRKTQHASECANEKEIFWYTKRRHIESHIVCQSYVSVYACVYQCVLHKTVKRQWNNQKFWTLSPVHNSYQIIIVKHLSHKSLIYPIFMI